MGWKLLGPGGEFEGRFQVVAFAIIKSMDNLQAFSSVFPWVREVPPIIATLQQAQRPIQASALTDSEKEVLKLANRLREIFKLEESFAAGEILAENQQQKLSCKAECI